MTHSARFDTALLATVAVAVSLGCGNGAGRGSVSQGSMRDVSDARPAPRPVASDADGGELTIYKMSTQIGTVAKRAFRDSSGRFTKTIYYTSTSLSPTGPYPEETLRVQSVVIHRHGRNRREEHRGPDMALRRIRDTVYQNGNKAIVWRRPDETREYEIRYSGNRSISHLYFDQTGQKLVGVSGAIPSDVDLAWGWGRTDGGLTCGIGASHTSGPLKQVRIYVTIRNLTEAPAKVVTALPYRVVQMELRDAEDKIVPQDVARIAERNSDLIRMNPGANENIQTIRPHEAAMYTGGYELGDWYSDLQTGTCHVTVRRRAGGKEFSLVSNSLKLEIQDEK